MEENNLTTIQITKDTREKLVGIGKKNQTYDELINMLVDEFVGNRKGI